jgi:hypothetical protein
MHIRSEFQFWTKADIRASGTIAGRGHLFGKGVHDGDRTQEKRTGYSAAKTRYSAGAPARGNSSGQEFSRERISAYAALGDRFTAAVESKIIAPVRRQLHAPGGGGSEEDALSAVPSPEAGLPFPFLIAVDLFGKGKPLVANVLVLASKFGVMHMLRALEALGGFRTAFFRFRHSTPRAAGPLSTFRARCGSGKRGRVKTHGR